MELLEKIKQLKPYQQKTIERILDKLGLINSIEVRTEASFNMICRKCGKNHFVKNGTINSLQRFKCCDCASTQFSDANTSLYNMKKKDKWADFVLIMLDDERPKTIFKISEELDINYKTSFRWRHKFLTALNNVNTIKLSDETELDEVYFPFCVKGTIGKEKYDNYISPDNEDNVESAFRKEEKRMERENYQSIFLCIHNRNKDFDFVPIKIQKKGSVSEVDLTKATHNIELQSKTVITDSEPSMKAFLKTVPDVNHLTFKSSQVKQGIIEEKNVHNNNINNTMMLFRNWFKMFHGISTKYQINYLKWFRFIRQFAIYKMKEMIKFSVEDKMAYPNYKSIFQDYVNFANT